MIVKSIGVENWRSLVNRREFVLHEGITILHGPNGQGKSSLVEALRMAFFDRFSLAGETLARIRPWGREVGPRVEVVFDEQGTAYRLTKRFLTEKCCTVDRMESGAWIRYKEGDGADTWLRDLFAAEAPGRGAAKEINLGLARVLWIPQGGLPAFGGITEALRERLSGSGAAGITVAAPANRLDEKVRAEYLAFFTEKGAPRSGAGSLREAQEALEQKRTSVTRLRTQLDATAQTQITLQDRLRIAAERRAQIEALSREQSLLEGMAHVYHTDQITLERVTKQVAQLRAARDGLKTRIGQVREAGVNREQAQSRCVSLGTNIDKMRISLDTAARQEAEARQELGRLDKEAEAAAAARRSAHDAREWHAGVRARDALVGRRDELRDLENRVRKGSEKRGALRAPAKSEIAALRKTLEEHREAQRELGALALNLEFTAARDLRVTTTAGQPEGEVRVGAGQALGVHGLGEIRIEIADVGTLHVRGPISESAEQLERAAAKAQEHIRGVEERFGTADPEELEERLLAARRLEEGLQGHRDRMVKLLQGSTPEELIAAVAYHESVLDELRVRYPVWTGRAPDEKDLQRLADGLNDELSAKRQKVSGALERAGAERGKIQEMLDAARLQQNDAGRTAARLAERIRELLGEREVADFEKELEEVNAELALAERGCRGAAEKLSAYDGDPGARRDELQTRLQGMRDLLAGDEGVIIECRTRLNTHNSQGTYSRAAELDEEIGAEQARLEALMLRAEALQLLWKTIQAVRTEQRDTFASPVADRAVRIFRQINARRSYAVRLDESLGLTGFLPEMAGGEERSIDELSGGEREQATFAVRLALAEQLVPPEAGRHLIVMDDFLTATDDARLSRIKEVVAAQAQRFQFLILTCHPERYAGMGGAKMVEIR